MHLSPEDMYGKPIAPDYSHIESPERAVRTALIDLGFEYEDRAFFFHDLPSNKIFYVGLEHLHNFTQLFALIEKFMQDPQSDPACIALLQSVQDRLRRLENRWLRRNFTVYSGGALTPETSKPA